MSETWIIAAKASQRRWDLTRKISPIVQLYRQSGIFAREGVDLGRSALAGWVGLARPVSSAGALKVLRLFFGDTLLRDTRVAHIR
jgi:hypothetical protein